jgi:tRNA G18 (ribose-2'-O)-methylase SpoU
MAEGIKVVEGDRRESSHLDSPIVIILDRLRSTHNVGNILRLADAIRARKVICGGYTACPPHPKLAKTAMGAEEIVDCEHYEQAADAAEHYREQGYEIIGVETVDGADSIWDCSFKGPCAFIFGNEALGLQENTLKQCDRFVRLPAFGLKNSINVSNCAAVVLYKAAEYLR